MKIAIEGCEVRLRSPAAARGHGIGMIYQELSLAPAISVAENLLVGRLPRRAGILLDRAEMERAARRLLERVGLQLDPSIAVAEISQHEAQLVEIAKALGASPRILVMDEPTSALSRREVQRLFTSTRRRRRRVRRVSPAAPTYFEVSPAAPAVAADSAAPPTCSPPHFCRSRLLFTAALEERPWPLCSTSVTQLDVSSPLI